MQALRKRKNRQRIKRVLRRSTPKSSILNMLATNYKDFYVKFVHRRNFFTQSFRHIKHSSKIQKSNYRAQNSLCYVSEHALNSDLTTVPNNCNCVNEQYCVSYQTLLMSGDIELNPGPVQNENREARIILPSHVLLEQRLRHFQLRPFDVGGAGDCFLELFHISYMVIQVIT